MFFVLQKIWKNTKKSFVVTFPYFFLVWVKYSFQRIFSKSLKVPLSKIKSMNCSCALNMKFDACAKTALIPAM